VPNRRQVYAVGKVLANSCIAHISFFLTKKVEFGTVEINHFTNQQTFIMKKTYLIAAVLPIEKLFTRLPDYGAE
jgi:hypothetical protein